MENSAALGVGRTTLTSHFQALALLCRGFPIMSSPKSTNQSPYFIHVTSDSPVVMILEISRDSELLLLLNVHISTVRAHLFVKSQLIH